MLEVVKQNIEIPKEKVRERDRALMEIERIKEWALTKDVLLKIEKELLDKPQDFPCPVHHYFGPGLYIRELFVPAGVVGMGHVQKLEHFNNFVSGRVRLMNDDGSHTELFAPMAFVGKPGRKVVYVIEDMVWQNIYATNERDVEILEDTYLEKSAQSTAYYSKLTDEQKKKIEIDRADFLEALGEYNLTEEYVKEESIRTDNIQEMPYGWFKSCVRKSPIHGRGFYSSAFFDAGETIAPLVINGRRTPASRYTNHSAAPNATGVVMDNGDVFLVAIKDIAGCMSGDNGQEITIDYRESMEFRKKKEVSL